MPQKRNVLRLSQDVPSNSPPPRYCSACVPTIGSFTRLVNGTSVCSRSTKGLSYCSERSECSKADGLLVRPSTHSRPDRIPAGDEELLATGHNRPRSGDHSRPACLDVWRPCRHPVSDGSLHRLTADDESAVKTFPPQIRKTAVVADEPPSAPRTFAPVEAQSGNEKRDHPADHDAASQCVWPQCHQSSDWKEPEEQE